MTPEFSKAVDPVFLHILGLLERIGQQSPDPADEQAQIVSLLDRAQARLGERPEWMLAKYALVSWADEVLVEAPWAGSEWWNNNCLEIRLFNTRVCHAEFFEKSKEASTVQQKDSLEIFYVCVLLGFRGLYRDTTAAAVLIDARGLPPDLESWVKQIGMSVRLGQGRPPLHDSGEPGYGAPPLSGQSLLIWSSLSCVVLAAFAAVLAGFLLLPGTSS